MLDRSTAVLRALDKLAKIGTDRVADEMVAVGISAEATAQILAMATASGASDALLGLLRPLVAGSQVGEAGIEQLTQLLAGVAAAGAAPQRIQLDVSIARGLDYYTGVVFETLLDDQPELGSVCSGGRYDNLAGVYSNQDLPGVGASLGLDRLLEAAAQGADSETEHTPAEVLIPFFAADHLHDYLRLAAALRAVGYRVEVYPEAKKLGKQLQYADRRGFRVALIAGEDEFRDRVCQLKLLATGESVSVPLETDAASIASELARLLEGRVA